MIRRSVALLMALVVFVSVNAAALVSASAQLALPGSTLVTDVSVQQETAQLQSVDHFKANGGWAVVARDSSQPEMLAYRSIDPLSASLLDLLRPNPRAHLAGTSIAVVDDATLAQRLLTGASTTAVESISSTLTEATAITVQSIQGFEPSGGVAIAISDAQAATLLSYEALEQNTLLGVQSLDPAAIGTATAVAPVDPLDVFPIVVDPPPVTVIAPDPDPVTVDPSPVGPVTVAPFDPDPVVVDGVDPAPVIADPPPVTQPGIDPAPVIADPPPIYIDGPDPAPVIADPPPVTQPGIDPAPVIADPGPIYIPGPDPGPVIADPGPVPPIYIGVPPLPPACIPVSTVTDILEQRDPTGPVNEVLFLLQQLLAEAPPIAINAAAITDVQDLLAGILQGSTTSGTTPLVGIEEAIIYLGLLDASSQASVATVGVGDICLEFTGLPDFYFPGIDPPAIIIDPQPVPDVNKDPAPVIVDPQPIPGVTQDPAAVIIDPQPVPDVNKDLAPVVVDPQPIPGVTQDPAAVIIDPQPVPDVNKDLAPVVVDPQPIPGVTQDPAAVVIDPQPVDDVIVDPPAFCSGGPDPITPSCTIPAIDAPPVTVDVPGACTVAVSAGGSCTIDPSPVATIDPNSLPPLPGGVPTPVAPESVCESPAMNPLDGSVANQTQAAGMEPTEAPTVCSLGLGELPITDGGEILPLPSLDPLDAGTTEHSRLGTDGGEDTSASMFSETSASDPGCADDGQDGTGVIGCDDRRDLDESRYPYRAIADISVKFPSTAGRSDCTGFLIDANLILTVGHCIHDGNEWAARGTDFGTGTQVYVGRDGDTWQRRCATVKFYSNTRWTQQRVATSDYGAIKIDCSIGERVGWFGTQATSGNVSGTVTITSGYSFDQFHTQKYTTKPITHSGDELLFYEHDHRGGASGAPVFIAGPKAIAIAAGADCGKSRDNCGTRITDHRVEIFRSWKRDA